MMETQPYRIVEDWQFEILAEYFTSRQMVNYLEPGSSLYEFHKMRKEYMEEQMGLLATEKPLVRRG